MSNFILLNLYEHPWTAGAKHSRPIRVNAERIEIMENAKEPDGTKITIGGTILRVEEDINTILFRITQGEKQ
jgi:uncharacterized protein YlzI (FlbEa/FlbD family)